MMSEKQPIGKEDTNADASNTDVNWRVMWRLLKHMKHTNPSQYNDFIDTLNADELRKIEFVAKSSDNHPQC
jgi:hypothetical protein